MSNPDELRRFIHGALNDLMEGAPVYNIDGVVDAIMARVMIEIDDLNELCRGLNLALKLANRTNEDLSEEVRRYQAGLVYDQGWDHGFLAGRKHAKEQAERRIEEL